MITIADSVKPEFKTACDGGGSCVEVAFTQFVLVRDSKDPNGAVLIFTMEEWIDFIQGAKLGRFDA
jgi:hypothetical protein